jgi:O-antigen/teichoic acid export membrane protein
MYNKIIGTFSSKIYSSVVSFAVIIITSRYLGPYGRGEISLFLANIAFVQLFNEIIIGPAMVFLVPRHKTFLLFFISIIWSLLLTCIVVTATYLTKISDEINSLNLFYLSLLYAIFSSGMMILQGKQKIKIYNLINILQSTILLIVVSLFCFVPNEPLLINAPLYLYTLALYFAYTVPLFISTGYVLKFCEDFKLEGLWKEFIAILQIGFNAQISNFLNFINTRVSYYIIAIIYLDESSLGIFAVATSLIESVWLVSYSIATIQYPIISSTKNIGHAAEISLNFSKLTFWISAIIIVIMIALPESLYLLILGEKFAGVKELILLLSPGIIVLSVSKIYWNYFSGLGKFRINNIAGLIGLFGTILYSYYLIDNFGTKGAAYSTVITYFLTSIYLFWVFKIYSKFSIKQLLPALSDYKLFQKL